LPTITGPIRSNGYFLSRDFTIAQSFTNRPIKMTLPGPMTIGDTLADDYYGDAKQRGSDIAEALNKEVLELAKVGCRYIQIDDPLFARYPQDALTYGFDHIEKCFHNCPQSVLRTVHICCGYPDRLDNPNFPKAPPQSYLTLSNAIENSSIQAVSIEDAHMNNDLSLLDHFKTTTVILGVVAIATTRVETVEEIEARLKVALDYIDRERLMVAPDCGLRMLGRDLALNKLVNLATAAKRIE
jgi:5-methyltetrahydropteroyltriglutamate--homocysteine methyltransferase